VTTWAKKLTSTLEISPQGKLTSKNSKRSISSIYSPLRSTSEASILPQPNEMSVTDSPTSSSLFSSEDDFSSTQHHNKLQFWILGPCQFDSTSLPTYQMIETLEKQRHRRTNRGGNIQNWNAYTQLDDFSKTTARHVEKYTTALCLYQAQHHRSIIVTMESNTAVSAMMNKIYHNLCYLLQEEQAVVVNKTLLLQIGCNSLIALLS